MGCWMQSFGATRGLASRSESRRSQHVIPQVRVRSRRWIRRTTRPHRDATTRVRRNRILDSTHPSQSCAIILHEPASKVVHHVTKQRASLGYFVRRCWAEGISKAEVARRVGRSRALSTERQYCPGVAQRDRTGFHDSVTGDPWGAGRSLMIILGLATTAAGYCVGPYMALRHRQGEEDGSSWVGPGAYSFAALAEQLLCYRRRS